MATPPALPVTDPTRDHLRLTWLDAGIAEVRLCNPQRRNAMSEAMTSTWESVMHGLAGMPQVRVVVVTGEGSAFCAGGDLGWIGNSDIPLSDLMDKMRTFYGQWLSVARLPVPTIAAINGPAVGAGAAVALACDVRWAGPAASFSVPFTRLGLHPGMGTTFLLSHVTGPAMARDLLFTGRTLDAQAMMAAGIVTAVLDGDFGEQVLDGARRVAEAAPLATRLTKQALLPRPPADLGEALVWEGLAQPVTMMTEDLAEGLAAAAERRRPVFRGR